MSRGPFQGTFSPNLRPVVVTAPDAFVLINQNSQVTGCPTCNRTFDINKYITSITVDLSVDSAPGSASINLSVPRHCIDDFYFDNNPVISPMMEVNIYGKGYYLINGMTQYYPMFWGLITEVNDSYSSGEHTVSLHCADILKWWELCRMNINPAYTSPVPSQMGLTLNGNTFSGMNPFDIIWTLAQNAFGDIVQGGGSLVTLMQQKNPQQKSFMAALSDIMAYWTQRFQLMSTNLLLYGSTGTLVRGDQLQRQMLKQKSAKGVPSNMASVNIATGGGGPGAAQAGYDPQDPNVTAFRTNNSNLAVNFWQSEYQTKLEIANAAKEAIGYEFFMDVTGDIVFKPPFYNLDILSNKPVSWIQDIDVIEWDLSDSEAEVITMLTIGGNFTGNTDWSFPAEMTPFANVVDYHLLRKYGWRTQQLNSEFLGSGTDTLSMFYFGLDVLDKINAKRHRGTVTIPFRPELRLGFPVYLASKDQMWYVQGISHNIAFGSRATTTLTLTSRREKFKAPQGICTLQLTSYNPNAAVTVPGSGTVVTTGAANPGGQAFQYTGKQLSDGGTFQLNVPNDPAISPITQNMTGTAPSQNPYTPLILRNPQTGRILGYPNVVMSYLQPYAPDVKSWEAAAGANPNVTGQYEKGKNLSKTAAQDATNTSGQVIYNTVQELNLKHLVDRTQFGFTSAGSFVYAHDIGKLGSSPTLKNIGVIGDLVLIPAGKLTTTPMLPGQTKPVSNATIMIRPVSDERGFEVIGHYRYGRGLALSDGQFITTGSKTQQASVGVQMALSGDLYATLTAQSQGLTPQSGAQYNPSNVIANLQPSDLQTSGFVNPGSPSPQYGSTGTNFLPTGPQSAPPQGIYSSVEAAQLSNGLTLAEMTVIDPVGSSQDGIDSTKPPCMCLLGRSDLAFMNQGYNVQNLMPVMGDDWNMGTWRGAVTPGITSTGSNIDLSLGIIPDAQLDQVTTSVDTFLWNLYSSLDAPHQQYEQQLRGGIYQAPQNSQGQAVNPTSLNTGGTAPPFNAATRYAVGDPLAAIQQAQSSVAGLSKAWNTFGQTLQATMNIGQLSAQISADQANLAILQKQLAQVQSGALAGSAFYNLAGAGNTPTTAAELQTSITQLTQKIANEELQLGQAQNQQAQVGPVPGQLVR